MNLALNRILGHLDLDRLSSVDQGRRGSDCRYTTSKVDREDDEAKDEWVDGEALSMMNKMVDSVADTVSALKDRQTNQGIVDPADGIDVLEDFEKVADDDLPMLVPA